MNKEKILEICEQYEVLPDIIDVIRTGERILARVQSRSDAYYLKGEMADADYWEDCCQYARLLDEEGMAVSNYIQTTIGSYVCGEDGYAFTLEEEVAGDELISITDELIYEIGQMLGELHRISLQLNTPFSSATSWSMFGGNATDDLGDYDENELSFLEFKQQFEKHSVFQEIERLYLDCRQKLKEEWGQLPQGAVQGDCCYYNMIRQPDGALALYDFNLAGNEVYLNESVAVGIYHAWHAPYVGTLTEQERFRRFMDAYTAKRPFTPQEQKLVPIATSVIRAFRFDRVDAGVRGNRGRQERTFHERDVEYLAASSTKQPLIE